MRWALLGLLAVAGCRRAPPPDTSAALEVANLTLAFPREEQGDLFFEVQLPVEVRRVLSLRWELWLGARRFAEGVVMAPDISADAAGRRWARVEVPLVYRHLGFREGATWLDVGLRGDVLPFGADEGGRLGFKVRKEVLVTSAPQLERVE
ncbi:MAG: hypothetical protein JNJ54_25195 [Myxococcaceae bacterium]|nr:hypothetical protein [Myxococcaceae bacterium]